MRRVLVLSVVVLVAGVVVALAAGGPSGSAGRWVVRDLGTLGGKESAAWGINERGQVLVDSDEGDFLWSEGRLTEIPGGPWALNNLGQVVGGFRIGTGNNWQSHGFVWQDGAMLDITPESRDAGARAINDRSQVTGWTGTVDGDQKIKAAFVWQAGTLTVLEWLPGEWFTYPTAINERGQIAGYSGWRAVRWDSGRITDLGMLPGDTHSRAVAISARGQVVGWSTRPRPGYALIDQAHAVLWTAARRMVDLGRGQATAINASGQIIGTTREGGRFPGFVWQSGRRSLLPFSPYAISDRGQIVGMIDTGKKGPGCFPFDTCHAAVVWQKGHITRLPGLGGSANAEDINNNGQIVDWANTKTGQEHAVLWTKTG